ncbi:MAG: insulinase family protein [Holophagales bacterium]|nr:insulinase family protein [Holophagales bacterium]
MNVLRGRTLAALLAAALALAAPLSAQELNVVERTLPNGMKVLMVPRHDQPTISCGWLARVGSANERPGITGLAHLFEHMMFKGTRTIGTKDAARDLELNRLQDEVQVGIREEMSLLREKQRRGEIRDMMDPAVRTPRLSELLAKFDALVTEQRGLIVKDEMDKLYQEQGSTGLNASTSEDRTFYIVGIPSNKLELWMWLESDRLANPVFREFYSERNVILEERRQTLESRPGGTVDEAFNAMTWMAHPYSWEVIGWPSDISQVTREQGSEFFATYYAPNNITAILVGDLDVEKTWALAQKYLGRIPANPKGVPEVITLEPVQPAEQRMVAEVERTPAVEADYKAVPAVHRDAAALQVLGVVLGGAPMTGRPGMGGPMRPPSGRLHRSLVLDKKVATRASASFRGQKYGGLFAVSATPAPGKRPDEVEPLLYAEVEKVVKEGVTDDELSRAKNAIRVAWYSRLESNSGIRESLSQAESAGTYRDLLDAPKKVEAVTREDVARVAKQYLVKESRNVLLTTRKGGGEGMPRRRPGGPPPGMAPGAPPAGMPGTAPAMPPAAAPAPEVKG